MKDMPAPDRSLIWQPIFDRPIALEAVAADIRPIDQRLRDFGAAAAAMRAAPHETPAIIEVLGLLECTYGTLALQRALPLVCTVLAAAVATLGIPLALLAIQRGYPHAGALTGALLEDALQISPKPPPLRRVPAAGFRARSGSPHLEFEDIALGAQVLACTPEMSDLDAQAVRAAALLVQALRGQLGTAVLAQRLGRVSSLSGLETLARAHGVALPAAWRRFMAQRTMRARLWAEAHV